jgi:hypothetical protein
MAKRLENTPLLNIHADLEAATAVLDQAQSALDRAERFKTTAQIAVHPARRAVDEAVLLAAEGDHAAPVKAARALSDAITIEESATRAVALKLSERDDAGALHARAARVVAREKAAIALAATEAGVRATVDNEVAALATAVDSVTTLCEAAIEASRQAGGSARANQGFSTDTTTSVAMRRIAESLPAALKRALATV